MTSMTYNSCFLSSLGWFANHWRHLREEKKTFFNFKLQTQTILLYKHILTISTVCDCLQCHMINDFLFGGMLPKIYTIRFKRVTQHEDSSMSAQPAACLPFPLTVKLMVSSFTKIFHVLILFNR